jgi:hypothetical protein
VADNVLNAPHGFEWIRRLLRWRLEADRLIVTAQSSGGGEVELAFTCLGDHAWRMQLAPGGDPFPDLPVLLSEPKPQPLRVVEDIGCLTASSGGLALQIEQDPWCVSLRDENGGVISREG